MTVFKDDLVTLLRRRWFWAAIVAIAILAVFWGIFLGRGPDDRVAKLRKSNNVAALEEIAKGADPVEAGRAIAAMGYVGQRAEAALLKCTEDKRHELRVRAVLALAKAGRRKHAARLAEVLRKDSSEHVRAAAAAQLGQIYACEQVPDLINALDDSSATVRRHVGKSLERVVGVRPYYPPSGSKKKDREQIMEYYRGMWGVYGPSVTDWHWKDMKR